MTKPNWHEKMVEYLTLRGRSENTIRTYLAAVKNFFKYYGKDRVPESITHEEYREYFLHLIKERKYSNAAVKSHLHGTRVLFKDILGNDWYAFDLLKDMPQVQKLPTILTQSEVGKILRNFSDLRFRCFYLLVYSCGLRLNEALTLKCKDIDRPRSILTVRDGKGNKDRKVPLPPYTISMLDKYWRVHRNRTYMFPSYGRGRNSRNSVGNAATATKHVSKSTVQQALRANLGTLDFGEQQITTHTFRHCYATHLLENGVDIRNVQLFLGHADIKTTIKYLHMTKVGLEKAIAIINKLMGGRK